MIPAKLPPQLIQPKQRLLKDVRVGETCYLFTPDMTVDLDGSCYLYVDAKLMDVFTRMLTITVERREDGFHVTVSPENHWEARAITKGEELIPVASITVTETKGA